MQLKFTFRLVLFVLLFSNCKGKQTESSTAPSYIPLNQSQNIVLDISNLFSTAESDSLTHKIIQYEEKSTNEIVILTVDSLPKNTKIQNFGTQVSNHWGIGKKDKDNGLLITISKFDRSVAISTGNGTKQTISDYDCKVIIDNIMIPQFKKKDYYQGVNKALDSIILLWD